MLSALLATLVLTAADVAQPPPAVMPWPTDVVYDGKPRDADWLGKAYAKVGGRIVLCDGKFYNLDEPALHAKRDSTTRERMLGKVVSVENAVAVCDTGAKAIVTAAVRGPADLAEGTEVMLTASHLKPPAPDWQAQAIAPRPITREQFVAAIRAGLQLFYILPCPVCHGKGFIIAKADFDYSRGNAEPRPGGKRECVRCKGVGTIPVATFKR